MEFQIHTNLELLPSVIDFNFEQLKQELTENLKYYTGLVVTEDSVKEAKADKAKLNALRKAIDDKRKDVKKACLAPYDAFEVKVKELLALIDAPVLAIDGQVKAFDEIVKTGKRNALCEYYEANIGDLLPLLPLTKIWDDRWLNVTFALKEAQETITAAIVKVGNDIKIIKSMNLECEKQVTDVYLRTLDMSKALEEKSRYEDQQKKLAEYEAKKAAEAAECEARQTAEAVARPAAEPQREPISFAEPITETYLYHPEPAVMSSEEPKTIKVIFYETTAAFRANMRMLTEKYGIQYGGIN